MELLGGQEERFRAKFGRKMGPDDPVFFDPDADEPTPLPAEYYNDLLKTFADQSDDPRLRALALASLDVGYMVTEMNQHLFTAYEVEAFTTAVTRHLGESQDEAGLSEQVREWLYGIVGLLADRAADADLPRFVLTRLLELDDEDGDVASEEIGVIVSMMVVLPLGWLVAAREAGISDEQLNAAMQWVADTFGGIDYAGPAAAVASAIWGGEGGGVLAAKLGKSDLTLNDLDELLGQDLNPAMCWLTAGLVATAGNGDIDGGLGSSR